MNLAEKVVLTLSLNSDPKRAVRMKSYMRDLFDFYGIGSPERKKHCAGIYIESSELELNELIDQTNLLWKESHRECQYVAGDILIKNKKRLRKDDIDFIESLITSKSWWDTVDFIASHLAGILFYKYPDIRKSRTEEWLKSENIWLNRTCLLYQLKYKMETDFEQLKSYILLLKTKDEFFIQKAIGWSLRQYSKYNPKAVKNFIDENDLSKLAVKEGSKYV